MNNVVVFVYSILVEEYLNCFQFGVIIHEATIDAIHGSFYEDMSFFFLGKYLADDLWVAHRVDLFHFTFPRSMFPVLGILAVFSTLAIKTNG